MRSKRWLAAGLGGVCLLGAWAWAPLFEAPRVITGSETVDLSGSVRTPGCFPWKEGLTVRQVRDQGGGLTFMATREIRVRDATPAWTVKLKHQSQVRLSRFTNAASDGVFRLWEAWHLPGVPPFFGMLEPEYPVKAVVDLNTPGSDAVLDPHDQVIVNERPICVMVR